MSTILDTTVSSVQDPLVQSNMIGEDSAVCLVDSPTVCRIPRRSGVGRRPASGERLRSRASQGGKRTKRRRNEKRACEILAQDSQFIANPMFDEPDAEELILAPLPLADRSTEPKANGTKPPEGLPTYVSGLFQTPLLSKEQEVHLFRKMNYLKHRAQKLRENLNPKTASSVTLDEIEHLQNEANKTRSHIVQANLRLVVSVAKRFLSSGRNLDDLIGEGNLALLHAVEKFDFCRGTKFSTYATWAVTHSLSRFIQKDRKYRRHFFTQRDTVLGDQTDCRGPVTTKQYVRELRDSIEKLLSQVKEREARIIIARFGLGDTGKPQTLRRIGNDLGVTPERIRQILIRGMAKLQACALDQGIEPPAD